MDGNTTVAQAVRVSPTVAFATYQEGKQYQYGSAGPDKYDCSGLVMACYLQQDIELPHNAALQGRWFFDQGKLFPNNKSTRSRLTPGDVVFWYGQYDYPDSFGHDGLYVGRSWDLQRRMVIAAVDENHGVMRHRLNWALAPTAFGFLHHK